MSENPNREQAPPWAKIIATVGGLGNIKPGPGTWGSAFAVLLWFLTSRAISSQWQTGVLIVMALAAVAAGIPAATRVANSSGNKDPQNVIIDEVAGQWITLIAVPAAWKSLLVGFILFRGFDILKPPPIRQIEALPGGFGIVLDDVAAGFCALIVMHLLLYVGWL